MANFFEDNEDIQFLFNHMDLKRLATLSEQEFRFHEEFEHAPVDADDACDNYRRILGVVGEIAGDHVAPTAEATDTIGNTLNPDGSVTLAPGIAAAVRLLGKAELMGFTLPYRFDGLNAPGLV